jgi:tRNA uridine 5-carboxymethylaminomethyl modification enzyme
MSGYWSRMKLGIDISKEFDVVIVGGGHAGCEAGMAAARMGARTALFSLKSGRLAQMSCNPAIGGIAKGHLVREIDALGGIMGRIADRTGIQFRLLNSSRGPAVQAPRCQSDKYKYSNEMRNEMELQENLLLQDAEVSGLIFDGAVVQGVQLKDGRRVQAKSVVITTGTFLNGIIHIGNQSHAGGRISEPPSVMLAENLKALGLWIGRLKTGTPPRLDKRTIDYAQFEEQKGDPIPTYFSTKTMSCELPQISCHLGYTNERLHEVIRANLKRSALYGGFISGIGPRYCPSVEDKVVKFAGRERHQIFLEPEGLETDEVYVNGLSTSMPEEVQKEMIASVPGLEKARIIRPGYAIEYDFVQPTELYPTLETKKMAGLFMAGQINGTTGYEEAAAQGIVAGINAALKAGEQDPIVFPREESYIGIMVDDLVTRGVDEPYRMFTSRSEFRLLMRIDNADRRLAPLGHRLGLVSDSDYQGILNKYQEVDRLRAFMKEKRWSRTIECPGLESKLDATAVKGATLEEILRRPGVNIEDLAPLLQSHNRMPACEAVRRAAEIEIRYEGYIQQQMRDAEKIQRISSRRIPPDLDYSQIDGLSREMREKLRKVQPKDLAMASRIPGITPAAVSIIGIYLEIRQAGRKISSVNPGTQQE